MVMISVCVTTNTINASFIQTDLYCMYLYYFVNTLHSVVAFCLVALMSHFVYLDDFKVCGNKY